MNIIKGSTAVLQFTTYSYWSGDPATSTVANITGATIKAFIKQREGDADAAVVIPVIIGAVVDGINGIGSIPLTAANTNDLSYKSLVMEIVVKMADGTTYIRSGVFPLVIDSNVAKTLI